MAQQVKASAAMPDGRYRLNTQDPHGKREPTHYCKLSFSLYTGMVRCMCLTHKTNKIQVT